MSNFRAALILSVTVFASAGMLILGCPTNPPPSVPVTDAEASAPYSVAQAACNNLKAINCSDGLAANCATTLNNIETSKYFKIDLQKLASAKTIDEARAAGAQCTTIHN